MNTVQTTLENNKIIAEFLSVENPYNKGHYIYPNGIATELKDMRFSTNWNWLVQVVEKIKAIPNKEKFGMLKYEVDVILDVPNAQIVQGYKRLLGDKTNKYFDVVCYENDFITNVYNACVAFIKWYNKNFPKENKKVCK